jgi:hypothetical protein
MSIKMRLIEAITQLNETELVQFIRTYPQLDERWRVASLMAHEEDEKETTS